MTTTNTNIKAFSQLDSRVQSVLLSDPTKENNTISTLAKLNISKLTTEECQRYEELIADLSLKKCDKLSKFVNTFRYSGLRGAEGTQIPVQKYERLFHTLSDIYHTYSLDYLLWLSPGGDCETEHKECVKTILKEYLQKNQSIIISRNQLDPDINEEPYRIDRMLRQLKQGGLLDTPAAVVLASWFQCHPSKPETHLALEEVFDDYFGHAPYPVFAGYPSGHIDGQLTLPLQQFVEVDADNKKLTLLDFASSKKGIF